MGHFEDMNEPLYGYVVKIILKQDEPCNLKSCLAHLNETNTAHFLRRNDEINIVTAPDCKIKNVCG